MSVQTVDAPLDTPEVHLEGGLKIRNPENVPPEVCLEAEPKESLSFRTTPMSALKGDENAP